MVDSIGGTGISMGHMSGMKRPDPKEMFKKVDTDGDGAVSQTELQAMVEKMQERTGQSINVEESFTNADSDGSGSLSEEELKGFRESMRPPHEREAMMGGEPMDESATALKDALQSYLANADDQSIAELISFLKGASDSDSSSSSTSTSLLSITT
ncbi:EF-hand domain-containing protein [Geobacter sulfurreducens]|uniref:EF hand domain protein n=1 Tax=Geobacter sulfurreducens (strain ATCC 51573 / DSM 12127 / PCA) TaxID=243231 RepID=Q747Z4_GEOSL|nr:EF-hand domain-containing protein [Geobacter sulfurreducens]AAR36512.1 EF hand domain protein [Geobacter sulfurreducens PCA]AJY69360.1 hypothetical protein RW64_06920 [Geobacter sulfurreducens]QVW34915.1 EF-hand domain-containing protein [Geobacter sulfurreducens]UAC03786.1 EF-hand domain-containing protein [Geobacter sulfurreducens]HBB70966.1 hypothetical protein [Geobacter sulfurreducens]